MSEVNCLYRDPNGENDLLYVNLEKEDVLKMLQFGIDWKTISGLHMSEDCIREFADMVDWSLVTEHSCLSEEFVREFADRVDWNCISVQYQLSEKFIREFADRINWEYISWCQRLPESFIIEFKEKVSKDAVLSVQYISPETIDHLFD